jgi:hypothetical protein
MRSIRPALLAALVLALAAPAAAHARAHDQCANRLCTQYKPGTPSCHEHQGRHAIARCFIARAATHFDQPKSLAFAIAWRESRFNWRATNPSSGTAGLFQFAGRTWHSTPYGTHSPYQPRWAALAAMWMWKHGGYSHWSI